MKNDDIVYLTLIVGRNQKDAILSALLETGVHGATIVYGKGTVKASYLTKLLGLVPEENKAMLSCALSRRQSDVIFRILTERFHFDKPNTGIAFTIPIDRLSF